jgi:hypothetical protein
MAETNALNSTKLIYVGCKLPHGLVLELLEEQTADERKLAEAGLLSSRMSRPPKVVRSFTVKGANSLANDFTVRGLAQPTFPYAITPIPEEFWLAWLAKHQGSSMVTRGFIFAVPNERAAKSEAKEREPEKTGVEPLNPNVENDPRIPRGTTPETIVETDAAHLARLRKMNGR